MPADLNLEAVVFDFYRTLVDISTDEHSTMLWEDLASELRDLAPAADPESLERQYFALVARAQAESPHPYPEIDVPEIFVDLLEELGVEVARHYAESLALRFRVLSRSRLAPYPDTDLVVAALRRQFEIGVVTDAQRLFFEEERRAVGLEDAFDATIVSSDHGYRKPDRRLFDMAVAALNVPAEQTIFVGDDLQRDVVGALAAGLHAAHLDRSAPRGALLRDDASGRPYRVFPSLHALGKWLVV